MKPEEAIEIIETTKVLYKTKAVQDAFDMAVSAIKEVQQYHEIGTVEQVRNQKENLKIAYRIISDYESVGTVEECREAREIQTPEAPDYEGDGCDKDGNIIYDTWICPNCGERYEVDYDDYEHCPKCGKAILQENLEV